MPTATEKKKKMRVVLVGTRASIDIPEYWVLHLLQTNLVKDQRGYDVELIPDLPPLIGMGKEGLAFAIFYKRVDEEDTRQEVVAFDIQVFQRVMGSTHPLVPLWKKYRVRRGLEAMCGTLTTEMRRILDERKRNNVREQPESS